MILRLIFGGLVCLVRGHDDRTDHDVKYGRICLCPTCVFWRRCRRCMRWVRP